jgi:hypothetical protein
VSVCPFAGLPVIEGFGWTSATREETAVVNASSAPTAAPDGLEATTR